MGVGRPWHRAGSLAVSQAWLDGSRRTLTAPAGPAHSSSAHAPGVTESAPAGRAGALGSGAAFTSGTAFTSGARSGGVFGGTERLRD